jgi:hypothetical protein
MRTLPALAAVVVAAGVLAPGVSADAQTMPAPDPGPPVLRAHRPAPPYLPDTTRPVPMPHARPHGLPPVPIPHVRLDGPRPVPMPHLGEAPVPRLELPRR